MQLLEAYSLEIVDLLPTAFRQELEHHIGQHDYHETPVSRSLQKLHSASGLLKNVVL